MLFIQPRKLCDSRALRLDLLFTLTKVISLQKLTNLF